MKATILIIINGILHFALSQVDVTSWANAPGSLFPNSIGDGFECRQIGIYDPVIDEVRLYGGEDPMGAYTFNYTLNNEEFTSQNPTKLDRNVSVTPTAWAYDTTRQVIYYVDETNDNIYQLDPGNNDDITLFATLATSQTRPGLCVDEATGTVYSVGNQVINICTINDGCQSVSQTGLSVGNTEPVALNAMACYFYKGKVYTFGGLRITDGNDIANVFECYPSIPDNCTSNNLPRLNTVGSPTAQSRAFIRAVPIECFGEQYVALLGGRSSLNPSSESQLYNLEDRTIVRTTSTLLDSTIGPVAVFDSRREQIWAFGGLSNAALTGCSGNIQFSNVDICTTLDPTMDPTVDPTTDPTNDPTSDPTTDPTNDPTADPTADPTTNPTTGAPTLEPTMNPSEPPTVPTTSTSTSSTTTTTTTTYEPTEDGYTTSGSAYGVVIGLLIAICCIIVICALWYSKEEKQYGGGYGHAQAPAQVPMVVAAGGYGGGYDSGATGATAATGYDAPASGGYGDSKPAATGYNGGNSGGGGY